MKINPNFSSFKISSQGMSIQKKRMELITENIANTSTTRTSNGGPYQRKYLSVVQEQDKLRNQNNMMNINSELIIDNPNHLLPGQPDVKGFDTGLRVSEQVDKTDGELVYMPDHPDANEDGYVLMPNVSVVTEMVEMISASRSYEANVTAFNSAKEIAKMSLDI